MSLARSTVAGVVAEIEAYMASGPMGGKPAVKHFLGGRDGAAATNVERVVWVPKKRAEVQPMQQEQEGDVCKSKRTMLEVTVYAADFARLEQLVDGLTAALDDVLSDRAYQLPGEGEFGEPGASAAGYSFTRQIILNAPVFSGIFVPGHVATVTGSVATTDANGANPETGASFVAGP